MEIIGNEATPSDCDFGRTKTKKNENNQKKFPQTEKFFPFTPFFCKRQENRKKGRRWFGQGGGGKLVFYLFLMKNRRKRRLRQLRPQSPAPVSAGADADADATGAASSGSERRAASFSAGSNSFTMCSKLQKKKPHNHKKNFHSIVRR